ncbi:MAG: hypothetical protein AAF485_21145 [Chloroflexota bacterium]
MTLNRVINFLFYLGMVIVLTACGTTVPDSEPESQGQVEDTTTTKPTITVEASTAEAAPDEAITENSHSEDEENLLAGAEPVEIERDPDVPPLPFADNPDPALCGIPQPWNSDAPAYLSGIYESKLIQPIVFLYDSHLRRKVVAEAPHGAEIKIILSQSNPELNYYLVKIVGADQPNEGWIPAPFVSFEPPPTDL